MTPEEIAVSALAKMNNSTSVASESNGDGDDREEDDPKHDAKKAFRFPVEPVSIQSIPKRRGYMNHSYRDFSNVPPEMGWVRPTKLEDMSFSEKVHDILSNPENTKLIAWMSHGRAFKVLVPVVFERNICVRYFGHKRYSSFLRQLNNHGFKHITKGPDRNCYYHECMLRNMPHLCKYMPGSKDARRLIPDPDNEPDLYEISRSYPLAATATARAPPTDRISTPVISFEAPSSASVAPPVLLQARLASEVPWLADRLPAPKRMALPTLMIPETSSRLTLADISSTARPATSHPLLGLDVLAPVVPPPEHLLESVIEERLQSAVRDKVLFEAIRSRQKARAEQQLQENLQRQALFGCHC